jgi:hypothetical protein
MRGKYLPKKRLEELDRLLGQRDRSILLALQKCRYLTSGQIGRLLFTGHANQAAGLRAAHRVLVKLRDYGLVEPLERRIGGVRAGSGSYAWSLTESCVNLLNLNNEGCTPRKRSFEPSMNFLGHTLGVNEIYLQLIELCRRKHLELIKTELEPECWRGYTGENGKPAYMKPDMFAVTASDTFEDSWFIEVDMNTESPSIILEKCRRYTLYYKSGAEQKESGVFPLVVWLVPATARKENLKGRIAESAELPYKNIFIVITPDEFEALICNGAAEGGTC